MADHESGTWTAREDEMNLARRFLQWYTQPESTIEVYHAEVTKDRVPAKDDLTVRERSALLLNRTMAGILIIAFIAVLWLALRGQIVPDLLQNVLFGVLGWVGGAFCAYWRVSES